MHQRDVEEYINLAHVTGFCFLSKGQYDATTELKAPEDCCILILMTGDQKVHVTTPKAMECIRKYIKANLFDETKI